MFLLLFLTIIVQYCLNIVSCVDCHDDVLTEVDSMVSLEGSVVCNEHNVQSLIESFYPVNRREAKIVVIYYYVDQIDHPFLLLPNSTDPDYTFLWLSSSVLFFINPLVLHIISLRTFVAEYNYAHISIAPFSTNDENLIIGMLTNTTVWLKSYAEKRGSTLINGLVPASKGFSSYRKNIDKNDYYIHNPPMIFQYYSLLMGSCAVVIPLLASIAAPFLIHYSYAQLHTMTSREAEINQHSKLKFRNLLGGLVTSFCIFDLVVYLFYFWHVNTTVKEWSDGSEFNFVYPFLVFLLTLEFILAGLLSVILLAIAISYDTLIYVPSFFFIILCLDFNKQYYYNNNNKRITCHKFILILWQICGIFATLLSVIPLVLFLCSVFMLLFVDPIQVITNSALYIIIFTCVVYMFALYFQFIDSYYVEKDGNKKLDLYKTDLDINGKKTNSIKTIIVNGDRVSSMNPNDIKQTVGGCCYKAQIKYCFKVFLITCALVMIITVVVVLGFTYATIVFFAGNVDQISVFSSIGGLLPLALATALGWFLKQQASLYFSTGVMADLAEREHDVFEGPDSDLNQ